ncbi:sugar transferase [Nocardia sp. 2]|uniref:Sugar transferase n=1 Tax=Nocardia acididurans TaxID=2802282 RepID=A0ABS1M2M4_9NOCA|nr:sugar transferase [Nocardia acididurans]MBL1074079.1 sugar transferase [Nocardia acididurans]
MDFEISDGRVRPPRSGVSGAAVRPTHRVLDCLLAVLALLATAPVLLVIAVAVKISSQGPILHRAPRTGPGGMPFGMLEFRSMYVEVGPHLEALFASDAGNRLLPPREDPRMTPVGRVLRSYGLERLPHFVNVLRGEMTIVGRWPDAP